MDPDDEENEAEDEATVEDVPERNSRFERNIQRVEYNEIA